MTNPWQRQRDGDELEPMLWYGRFDKIYRPMGTERSLLGAVNRWRVQTGRKKYHAVPGAWNNAFERWQWKTRAEAWDIAELERIKEKFQKDADEWRANRFKDAAMLRDKALELLKLPTTTRIATREEMIGDKLVAVAYTVEAIPPTTLRAAAGILKTADELARITTRETLPTTEIDHKTGGEKIKSNVIIVREYVDEPTAD